MKTIFKTCKYSYIIIYIYMYVCVTLCPKEFQDISRGPMDTWMAWANEDPSKVSCKRTCIVWTVVQAVQFSLFGAMVVHVVKPYLLRTQHFDCIQPSRDSYGYLYPSDKCVLAGRPPKATRWHGSRCDPCESGQHVWPLYDVCSQVFPTLLFFCFSPCFLPFLPSADMF